MYEVEKTGKIAVSTEICLFESQKQTDNVSQVD